MAGLVFDTTGSLGPYKVHPRSRNWRSKIWFRSLLFRLVYWSLAVCS